MKTFYEILKIKNDASDKEINEAYNKLAKKYKKDKDILKNIDIAKEILLNPEARKNYDKRISEMEESKRQNDIISNITNNTQKYNLKQQELLKKEEERKQKVKYEEEKPIEKRTIKSPKAIKKQTDNSSKSENRISEKEQEKQRKKEIRKQNKLKKKEDKIQQELYQEAYAQYLQGLGFTVKRKWTWKRIKRLLISILVLIILCFILWQIPSIKKPILDTYEKNVVVKFFVDMIVAIFSAVLNGIKTLLKAGD